MIAFLQTSQKVFLESAGWALGQLLSSGSCNHICRNFWQLRFTGKFFYLILLLTNVTATWKYHAVEYKYILLVPMLSFNLTRSLSTQANHLGFTKPSNKLDSNYLLL